MKDIYFNSWRYIEAKKLIKKNPFEAKKKMEEYLKNYPKDYNAKSYYAYLLVVLNKPNEAQKVLENLEIESIMDSTFNRDTKKVLKLRNDIIINKMRILIYNNQYEEFLKYFEKYKYVLNNDKLSSIHFLCRKKLNILEECEYNKDNYGYLFGQILEYDENDFLLHIQKHQTDYNNDEEEPNANIFSEKFPINEIIEEVKKQIPSEDKLCYSMLSDSYFFKYNDCGRANNKITNYFLVACFHNTSDIITMCPVEDCENMPQIDLNYLNKNKVKVKSLSQIEKFNRRYKR